MSLKLDTWKLNVNGYEGTLTIQSVNEYGAVQGFMSSGREVTALNFVGIWDDTAHSISFGPLIQPPLGPGDILPVEIREFYRGFLFSTPAIPELGQDVLWTLSGFFEVTDPTRLSIYRANARRHTFGWSAQITEVA